MRDPLEALSAFGAQRDLPLGEQVLERFEAYLELLLKFRGSMNLIGPMSPEVIVRDLFIDSLTPALIAPPEAAILDVGTGAGFPGIPLKLCFPEVPVTLIEPRRKRQTFLKICIQRLGLERVTVLGERLEDIELSPHAFVISKAFRPPHTWVRLAYPRCADDGLIICMTRQGAAPQMREAAQQLGLTPAGHIQHVHPTADGVDDRVSYAWRKRA